jgi:hypothetical protein
MSDEAPKPALRGGLTEEKLTKLAGEKGLEKLPTGKPHVSFSEMRDWEDCSFRHKLKYVDKVGEFIPGIHLDFGTSAHAACEGFLKNRKMDRKVFLNMLKKLWEEHQPLDPKSFTSEAFKQFGQQGMAILAEVPEWFDKQFPGWELIDAEHPLYEALEGHPHAFKGFIDVVIKVPVTKGKKTTWLYWLLDWKTCSWGWSMEKKNDPLVRAQLVLYKNFWSGKTKTDPKDVRCGFVLLKRTAKNGARIELVTTSVGEVTTGRSLKVINNMVTSIKRGIAIKNRSACTFCDFYNTPHCT